MGQFAVSGDVETEGYLPLAGFLRRNHIAVIVGIERLDFLQFLQRPDDIFRRYRLAVMPARLRVEPVGSPRIVRRKTKGLRHKPVGGARLVDRLLEQRIPQDAAGTGVDHNRFTEGGGLACALVDVTTDDECRFFG